MVEIFDVNKLHHNMKAHETPLRKWTDLGLRLPMVIVLGLFHVFGIYGLFMLLTGEVPLYTILLTCFTFFWGGIGITAGVHRLWSHRSYEPTLILEIFLALCYSMTLQRSIKKWCINHKIHHLYQETVADPYDARRGFWFAQIGWMLTKEQPEVALAIAKHDHSWLENNPIVWLENKIYWPLAMFMTFGFPTLLAGYGWGDFRGGFYFGGMLRFVVTLHQVGFVNSVAHMFGDNPYSQIAASECRWASWLIWGEGWHNYHHTFPQDYSASEYGWSAQYNPTTLCIDFWVAIGLARNPIKVSTKKIERAKQKVINAGSGLPMKKRS